MPPITDDGDEEIVPYLEIGVAEIPITNLQSA